ncbi:MAG: hypothetical protein GX348_10145 [Veillonellaceae bacterium]|nr:hypothetical protein [Veillonellaceae bacterium]
MEFLFGLIVLVVVVVLSVWIYIVRQGDAEFEFLVDQRTEFTLVDMTENTATFSCKVPFVNKGTQDGTIMDAYTRHLLPYEQYDGVEVNSRLELETAPRTDGYFEALIVPKTTGQAVIVTVKLTAKNGNIREALGQMVDMPIDIVYQIVARSEWYITKNRLVMKSQEIAKAAGLKRAV